MDYNIVKSNYKKGLWPISAVKMSVDKGFITAEQYKEITGEDYVPATPRQ